MWITQEFVICCHVWPVYGIGMVILFYKHRYPFNPLHLYVTNNYIFVCSFMLLEHTICLTLVIANISSNRNLQPLQ